MIGIFSNLHQNLTRMLLVSGLTVTLSACGNDPNSGVGMRAAFDLMKGVSAQILAKVGVSIGGGEAAAPAPSSSAGGPLALVSEALTATDGKVMIAILETRNVVAIMGVAETNHGYETWEAADRRSLILKDGVLTASRGLGDDLMSSRSDASIAMIRARAEGHTTRSYNFLTGMGQISSLDVQCEIIEGSKDHVAAGEVDVDAITFAEICIADPLKIQNLYWVDSKGNIVKSRQWLSSEVGYVLFQHLRL